ncbi:vitamin K epoxide reductase family protein [Pedobacter sp. SG908]|uniref:vitamin K epoxide reductase family protein n=1 Tax=Pedobacter sp. SG908 TaxID=2587135 RepID=UPI00141E17C5|nr:vitamin K epoxide reductase family protein [Pedobacter sp. SG908]NII83142.1 putative membrane protein/thiol-disulfide isomerase/thioredoxin [Pedobacter sp. SG908]
MLKLLKNYFQPEENTLTVAYSLLKTLKVNVTQTSLKDRLEQHPQYPSLLCISDALNYYKVHNVTLRVTIERLKEIEQPFLTVLRYSDDLDAYFCLVKSHSVDGIKFLNSKTGRNEMQDWSEFEKIFQGIILIAEADQNSGDKNFKRERLIERKSRFTTNLLFLFVPICAITACIYKTRLGIFPFMYGILSYFGCLVTYLLLWFELDSSNKIFNTVCGRIQKNRSIGCDAVLKSEASSFLGISWSIWGAAFFHALLFTQLFKESHNGEILQSLKVISCLAVSYVPYSILYQWKIVKAWCRLCLMIQSLLFAQFLIVLCSDHFDTALLFSLSPFRWDGLLTFAAIGLLCILLADQFLKLAISNKLHKSELKESLKIKLDPIVFDSALKRQKPVNASTESLGILLGNPTSSNKIIKVCNPYCEPCARMHPILDGLLEQVADLSIQILFTASTNEKDERNKPVKHLLAIYESNGETLVRHSLDDWYNVPMKDYDRFAEKYKIEGDLNRQVEKVEKMHDWCKSMEIAYTPTIFFNGYQLPDAYTIKDIEYLLKS